jgi:mannose-6-phosphate isomerase-like protein (cupin superfamily)
MCLPAGGDIGEEVHQSTDQIFVIAHGSREVIVDGETRPIAKKDLIVVPAGSLHNIRNTGEEDLKFITIYAPPAHPDGTVEATKPLSDAQ